MTFQKEADFEEALIKVLADKECEKVDARKDVPAKWQQLPRNSL